MHFLHTFDRHAYLDSLVSYVLALVLGSLIGAERQYRQRTAGLRTNALVALGASAFVDLAQRLAGDIEAVRVISYTVSGVGFLGAGVIMKEGMNIRGLNTAATLWCSAAVGACAGTDMAAEATTLTAFVIAGNTLLRPVVNAINRIPLVGGSLEATCSIVLTTQAAAAPELRDLLVEHLDLARYPARSTEIASGPTIMPRFARRWRAVRRWTTISTPSSRTSPGRRTWTMPHGTCRPTTDRACVSSGPACSPRAHGDALMLSVPFRPRVRVWSG